MRYSQRCRPRSLSMYLRTRSIVRYALVSSDDLMALQELPVRNLGKSRQLATALSVARWARLRSGRGVRWAGAAGAAGAHGTLPSHLPPAHHRARAAGHCAGTVRVGADPGLWALWPRPGPGPPRRADEPPGGAGAGHRAGTLGSGEACSPGEWEWSGDW